MTQPTQYGQLLSRFSDILRLALSSGLAQGAALIALPLLQRDYYSPEAFAEFAVYAQCAGILGAVATMRLDLALVKQASLQEARATAEVGLQILIGMTLASAALVWALQFWGLAMGQIPLLWLWLPLGVLGLGLNGLITGWLSRDARFTDLAWIRGGGGVIGEGARFMTASMGNGGLIAGRILGQWAVGIWGLVRIAAQWRDAGRSSAETRAAALASARKYIRFTTPANVLAMAANGAFIFFLFESCAGNLVGSVGAGMAYLTVAAGLVIKSVNDVFFKHLDSVPDQALLKEYLRWLAGLLLASTMGVILLHRIPEDSVTQWLGASWSAMLPAMRILSPWMVPWIAASSLSGIFPHLGKQSWTLGLDTLHLLLMLGLILAARSTMPIGGFDEAATFAFLKQYNLIQGGFYVLAIAVSVLALCRGKS